MTLTQIAVVVLMTACATLAVYCKRSLVREARGHEAHAHADGTVHEHHRGSVPHSHPTLADRHDHLLARMFRTPS
jgi:hypothetical protein